MSRLKYIPLELLFWAGALILLGCAEPLGLREAHISLCPLASMGLEWCPGCGIGRSITHLLNGDVGTSLQHHWFGIPALLIIVHRVFVLTEREIRKLKIKYKEDKYV